MVDSLTDSQLLDTYPTTASAINSTNDQHTDTASQPDVEDQHKKSTNVTKDSSNPTTDNADNRMIIDTTSTLVDNDHRMNDNNDPIIDHDQHQQHTRQHLRNQNLIQHPAHVSRNMSQQRLQQSAGESPDPQHHQ
ncbi:hypothetical protein O0I10_000555 [Lichtheimia ornata]|uniref:Uncharacterized protein n=1 Tax=Lichtheimia ornata TaxID=688661 RepID=A0AAD8DIF5_9FUNG|nr:uncharacterized protein O0I10_000555 [Lichtheimia ornata]KAJ8663316.1 hypothetical protein O0I10_000555 [Lichtheimia ornata]